MGGQQNTLGLFKTMLDCHLLAIKTTFAALGGAYTPNALALVKVEVKAETNTLISLGYMQQYFIQ